MSISKELGKYAMDFVNSIRESNLQWLENNQLRYQHLETERRIAQAKSEHELSKLKLQYDSELKRLSAVYQEEERLHKNYLKQSDVLVHKLCEQYPAISNTPFETLIHHRINTILHLMWESGNLNERNYNEKRLGTLLKTIIEETEDYEIIASSSGVKKRLPEKTIGYIENNPI